MEVLAILAFGFVCLGCFLSGAKVGQAVQKGEKIETPGMNPLEAYREHQSRKEAEREGDRVATILANIDAYDGTGRGQKDVPKG
jgi:hypothetical protein